MMNANRIFKLIQVLRSIVEDAPSLSEGKIALKNALPNVLQDVLRMPTWTDMDEDLGAYLNRGGYLPGDLRTALLRYTLADLDSLSQCERDRLLSWMKASSEMLIAANAGALAKYKLDTSSDENCRQISDKGRLIPRVDGPVLPIPAAPPNSPDPSLFRLGHPDPSGTLIHWVPLNYLP
jgi:hypothetical protein